MKKLVGEFLVDKGLITEAQLKMALAKQPMVCQRLGDIFVDLQFISRDVLEYALNAAQERLLDIKVEDSLLSVFPASFLRRYGLFPLRQEGNTLFFAAVDTQRFDLWDDLKFVVDRPVELVLWQEKDIYEALDFYFPEERAQEPEFSLKTSLPFEEEVGPLAEDLVLGDDEAPINRLVNVIIVEAIVRRASDIHIEPFRDRLRLRYRIDGVLYEVAGPSLNLKGAFISRIKIMAGLDIAEKRLPQDGQISFGFQGKDVELRVSSMPSLYGEALALRILDKNKGLLTLDELGLLRHDRGTFEEMMRLSHGLILITGPTGSGKTTTLYSLLHIINTSDKKIITVEDPVEYQLSGMNQVQVHNKIHLSFTASLRAILRQAPNVIMIGEIRDTETANIAIQAALTGHLVLSTLHTSDAPGSVVRLFDMGVLPYKVASALKVVAAQGLVRRICKNCQVSYVPTEDEQRLWLKGAAIKCFRGEGCDMCLNTGYYGRVGLFQVMVVDETIREYIYAQNNGDMIRQELMQQSVASLWQDGLRKVDMGWTTLSEVCRVATEEIVNGA